MKTIIRSKRSARAKESSTRTAHKAASSPRAKKHHILADAAAQVGCDAARTSYKSLSSSPPLPLSLSAFNPALPEDGALIIAGVLRDQLNSLFSMIQSIPAGPPGPQGVPGIQGPPFANAIIDGVTTLPPSDTAWVSVTFDGTNVHFSFGIPQGQQGQQGPPGEVTTAQLNDAIASAISGTSSNTNSVPTMDTPFTNDPPTLADMETMRAAYNALVLAARR